MKQRVSLGQLGDTLSWLDGDIQAQFKCWMGEVVRGPVRERKNEMERDLPRDIVVSLD